MFAIVGVASVVHAQSNPAAEVLFRDARKLVKEGQLARACEAFEGSERLEHNINTLTNLADCREREGKLATAWALYLRLDSATRGDPTKASLNNLVKTRATALEGRLSYLTLNVPDESRITSLTLTRDGVLVDPAEWNRAIPADNGEHVVAGNAPGHEEWSTKVTLATGEKKSVEVPKFKELAKLVAPTEVVEPAPASRLDTSPSTFTPRRKVAVGLAVGALAIAGAAVGLGVRASSLREDALSTCPATACTSRAAATAQDLNDRARSRALLANVGFAVAGGAIITSAVLWLTGAPESARASVAPITGALTGVALWGAF